MNQPRPQWIDKLTGTLRTIGPYAAIVLLPGGSLIGLYWAIRRRSWLAGRIRGAASRTRGFSVMIPQNERGVEGVRDHDLPQSIPGYSYPDGTARGVCAGRTQSAG